MKKNIHILIPNFNKGPFIVKTIRSVLRQTYKHWQLTIIDNKSTDDSVLHIKKHFKKNLDNKSIKLIINKKHISQEQNWNLCLKNIGNYEYYKILCSDDTIETDHLERAVKALKHTDDRYYAYSCNIHYIDKNDNIIGKRSYGFYGFEFWLSLYYRNFIGTPSSMVFKTSEYDFYQFEKIAYVGDLLVSMDYYTKGQRVIFDKKIGSNFRLSKQSDTTKNYGSKDMLFGRRFLRQRVINKIHAPFIIKIILWLMSGIISMTEVVFFRLSRLFG